MQRIRASSTRPNVPKHFNTSANSHTTTLKSYTTSATTSISTNARPSTTHTKTTRSLSSSYRQPLKTQQSRLISHKKNLVSSFTSHKSLELSRSQISLASQPVLAFRRSFATLNTEDSDPAFAAQKKQPKTHNEQEEGAVDDLQSQIHDVVVNNKIVLFMKGTPDRPQCGFSSRVVQILAHLNVAYEACNVLDSSELREGIKVYSNWPTIPQLYVDGEFVGGCDIVTQMYQAGELHQLLGLEAPNLEQ